MASRRASAPCRSGIYVRSGPEKRLQNACREFCSTLLKNGQEGELGRRRSTSVWKGKHCDKVFRNVGHQVEFDWGRGLGIRCLHPAKPHLERLYDAAHALAR